MNKDDIIRMAREAGLRSAVLLHIYGKEDALCDSEIEELRQIEAFAALIASAEREACAEVCDSEATIEGIAQRCAAAIRARGQE
jgi:transposase